MDRAARKPLGRLDVLRVGSNLLAAIIVWCRLTAARMRDKSRRRSFGWNLSDLVSVLADFVSSLHPELRGKFDPVRPGVPLGRWFRDEL